MVSGALDNGSKLPAFQPQARKGKNSEIRDVKAAPCFPCCLQVYSPLPLQTTWGWHSSLHSAPGTPVWRELVDTSFRAPPAAWSTGPLPPPCTCFTLPLGLPAFGFLHFRFSWNLPSPGLFSSYLLMEGSAACPLLFSSGLHSLEEVVCCLVFKNRHVWL